MSKQEKIFTPRVLLLTGFFVIVIPLLPLLISWHWDWWEAWVYALVNILGFVISRVLAGRRNPDLLAERARFAQHDDVKEWDKVLFPLVVLGSGLIPLVAGLDARFGESAGFGLMLKIVAIAVLLAGFAIGSYALIENRFFSAVVRIQTERDHKVVSSGPYGWVRHPGYAGALLSYLANPFLLDSWWTFLPVLFLTTVLIIRTRLEDRTLQAELAGYTEYARQVPYRLLPGVW